MPLVRDTLGWGVVLWLIGYALGIILFFVMPPAAIGWVIAPVGILITIWVLLRRVATGGVARYALVALVWTAIAVVFDYFFIVRAFNPADGYYKPDVYLYYAATFALPIAVGWWRERRG
jgi:hypothetical protein